MPAVSPVRVSVNVNAVLPALPSGLVASAAAIVNTVSSLAIVPPAVAVASWAPSVASDSVTEKLSSGSTAVSPRTLTMIVLLASPAAKLTVPSGSVPPKSAASAAFVPLPATV